MRIQKSLNWMMVACGLLAITVLACAPTAWAATGIALYGNLKYSENFRHFEYVNPDAPKGGTLKLSTTATFDSVNPFILKGLAAPGIAGFVYQTLMTPSYDEPQSYYALIAESVTLSPDHKFADFVLNPKAVWDDGKPITADDVVWTFNTLKTQGHPSYRVLFKPISVQKIDARRVRFLFADTNQRELPLIAASMPVLPQHYFCSESVTNHQSPVASKEAKEESARETGGGRLAPACIPFDKTTLTPPVGSGPYRVKSIDPGRSITFERVKNYWAANLPTQIGLNNFDMIQFDVYRDDVVAAEGIKSHQFDYYEEYIARNWATAYDIPAVRDGQLIKARIPHKIPRGMQGFLFNTRESKFADDRVREAIGLTLDFEWMNKTLFYSAYERNSSYFNNTEFAASGRIGEEEVKMLDPYRKLLPKSIFNHAYKVPTTDGSGFARDNLIRAQKLLDDAGWVMKDGVRVNAQTGEALTIEFLMTQRTFERVIGIMRHNLDRLGIASSFRYVDASQYQKRLDHHQFDIVSIWWNQGTFYPGSEQYMFWHSSQADIEGSQNLGGVKNKAIDMLTEKIRHAQTLEELRPTARALDRVLLGEHYVIPHWNLSAWRVLYWDQFGRPAVTPAYNIGIDSWWAKGLDQSSPGTKKEVVTPAEAPGSISAKSVKMDTGVATQTGVTNPSKVAPSEQKRRPHD